MLDDEAYGEECLYCHGGTKYSSEFCPFCGGARRAAEEARTPERVDLAVGAYELPEVVLERVQF